MMIKVKEYKKKNFNLKKKLSKKWIEKWELKLIGMFFLFLNNDWIWYVVVIIFLNYILYSYIKLK